MIRIAKEQDLIEGDKGVELRKSVIACIKSPENQERKNESYRRHMCMKDKTSVYVVEKLVSQFDESTVIEMAYSLSNISIGKKIIEKLARVYANGVQRVVVKKDSAEVDDEITEKVQELSKLLKINSRMKTSNKYLRAHHNTIIGTLPCPVAEGGEMKFKLKIQALEPHLYDVVPHEYDKESPMVVITSDYKRVLPVKAVTDPGVHQQPATAAALTAPAPVDELANERFVWWTKSLHFTTNGKGEILPNMDGEMATENPLQELPFDNLAMDQDGQFWSEGGDDVFDGAVKTNAMITNVDHIGVTQGYGQFWMRGKDVPAMVKLGPNKMLRLNHADKDDPQPEAGFLTSDPKLQALKEQIVMYVALLLTTNNLSVKAVSAELGGSQDFASGISLLIDKAESIEDVQDQQQIFLDAEPSIWKKIARWQEIMKDKLDEAYREYVLPPDVEVSLKFADARPIMSEKERLEVLKMRKELGINTMIELLMMDDPSLTEAQAEERLKKILEEKIKAAAQAMVNGGLKPGAPNADGAPNGDANPAGDGQPNPGEPDANKEGKLDEGDPGDGQQQPDDEQD